MNRAIITGASSGLGKAIFNRWTADLGNAVDWSLTTGVDISDKFSITLAARDLPNRGIKDVDVLINCAGVNLIDFIPDLLEIDWDNVMNTNAKGIFLVTQALIQCGALAKGATILNIVSNASHVPMTNSLAYNASKAAAEIMTRQMSRELSKTHGFTVFGISPNKLKNTNMSNYIDKRVQELRKWTAEEARNYQLAVLPAGEETDPEVLAEFICFLLSSKERHKYLAGCVLEYGL